MKKLWFLLIVPALLLVWWALEARDATPEIHFAQTKRLQIESTVPTNGKVEPVEWAAARAEAAGLVQSISAQRGDSVPAGKVLVTLDTVAAQADLAAAIAREQESQAEDQTLQQGGKAGTLANLGNSIKGAHAAIDVAKRRYESLERLARQQAATPAQVQEAKDVLAQAQLQLSSLEDQKQTLVTSGDRQVSKAKISDAAAAVSLARHRLALGVVKAPITGTLYQFDLKVGAYLQPGELVGLVGKVDQVKVTVFVDEPDLGRVGQGMPVTITWDARPGQKWFGRVERLPTQVTNLGTRTVGEVTTIVENPNHDLLPGVTVNATVISAVVHDADGIPKEALRTVQGAPGVYKLTGNTVRWTPVQVGVSDVNNVQVVSGLHVGDRVARQTGDVEIKNGMRVKPVLD